MATAWPDDVWFISIFRLRREPIQKLLGSALRFKLSFILATFRQDVIQLPELVNDDVTSSPFFPLADLTNETWYIPLVELQSEFWNPNKIQIGISKVE